MADKESLINYAYKEFKDAQKEMIKQSNIMEYWFTRALKLKKTTQNTRNVKA